MSFLEAYGIFKRIGSARAKHALALWLLGKIVKWGRLRVTLPDGSVTELGDGSGQVCGMTLPPLSTVLLLVTRPDPNFPDAFVDGKWAVTEGELEDVLFLLLENEARAPGKAVRRLMQRIRVVTFRIRQHSPVHLSSRRVRHHYDLGNTLYSAFLDPEMFYSCAFYKSEADSLEQAQANKVATTIERLQVDGPEMSVLDIGCGWGGLTRAIVSQSKAEVTGITLSVEQFNLARERAKELSDALQGKLNYELCDYREHRKGDEDCYDRIVSIGMFEHVGLQQYNTFFRTVRRLLKPGGRAVLHTIARPYPATTSQWIDRNIFPGGYIPAISEIVAPAEAEGLRIEKVYTHEGRNYARTLAHWRERFRASQGDLVIHGYDERFARMWEFYFGGCINAFDVRQEGLFVTQVVLTK